MTTTPAALLRLVDRAERGSMLAAEARLLRDGIRDLAALLAAVAAECDRIEAAVRADPQDPDFDGAYLACLRHIRAVLNPAATEETS